VKKGKKADRLRKAIRTYWAQHGAAVLRYGLAQRGKRAPLGAGSTTYRAYGKVVGSKETPSALMKRWVRYNFGKRNKLGKCVDFVTFHQSALKSLVKYWNDHNRCNRKLKPVPYGTKLLDLQVKVCVWQQWNMTKKQRGRLLNSAYQPLDTYSLRLLRLLGVNTKKGKPISKRASMGAIKSEDAYEHFQKAIRAESDRMKIPIFAFDYYAWNMGSSGAMD
jgi:hypothetical protein